MNRATFKSPPMPPQSLQTEAAADPLFRRVVAVASGLALGGMLASLALFERAPHGKLAFRWHWAAFPLLAFGILLGLRFWSTLWQAQLENTPGARSRLRYFSLLLGIVAISSFLYPMRYVQASQRFDVFMGLGLAIVVLSGFGWLILKTIRLVSANEPADGESEPPSNP